jgi:hypothetical protein
LDSVHWPKNFWISFRRLKPATAAHADVIPAKQRQLRAGENSQHFAIGEFASISVSASTIQINPNKLFVEIKVKWPPLTPDSLPLILSA